MGTKKLYKGTIETFIFQLLSENEKMHGYEISKRIKEMTKGELVVSESAMYPALHGLESKGYLTASRVEVGKRVRKYYSLTKEGEKEAEDHLADLVNFLSIMQGLLKPQLRHI